MLTAVGHVQMRVRDFDRCRATYRAGLGLREIADGHGADGHRICMLAVGPSVLELLEDPKAVTALSPSGSVLAPREVPGSVGHMAYYASDNEKAFVTLRDAGIPLTTTDGPSLQPIDHCYMQRTLVEFRDPNGLVVQVAEVVDPREHLVARRTAKRKLTAEVGEGKIIQGIDHINIACSDIDANRPLFVEKLGLEEIVFRTTEGRGESVVVVGITDLEIAQIDTAERGKLGPGIVSGLGFWTDDVELCYRILKGQGVAVGGPPSERTPLPGVGRVAFNIEGLDGLPLEIAQRI